MSSTAEQIKERLGIVEVVSAYLKLEKAGSNLKSRCPFHHERTPSFFVSPSRNSFHCFGCAKGGDIFTFVEEIEGVPFSAALKILADRAGIAIQSVDPEARSEELRIFSVLEEAAKFFESRLALEPEAVKYLLGRGLTKETIKSFRIGFAPESWQSLLDHLKKKNFSESTMDKAGLIVRGQRGFYDRFRKRIMFPIASPNGKIVGFSGRIFRESKDSGQNVSAKYVNSPETPLFNKSKILYGYDRAKRGLLQKNYCILVEGQMDLIMAHQAGSDNTVASSGTALTQDQIHLIKRFTDNLVLAFDADQAGLKAAERGVKIALAEGLEVKIAKIPKGLDPADLILKDRKLWEESIKQSKHIVDFYLDTLSAENLDKRIFRKAVSEKALPYVASIVSPVEQSHFIKEIAERLEIDEGMVRDEIGKIAKGEVSIVPEREPPKGNIKQEIEEKVYGIALWTQEKEKMDLGEIDEYYLEATGKRLSEEIKKLPGNKKQDLIFQAEMYYAGSKDLKKDIFELMANLERKMLEENFQALTKTLKQAEKTGDPGKVEEILKKCQIISKRLEEIKHKHFK
jgi:DNA primase